MNDIKQLWRGNNYVIEKPLHKQDNYSSKKANVLIYEEILKKSLQGTFTGIETKNDTTFTNALHIKLLNNDTIEYRLESLINWKSQKDRKGFVLVDSNSINSNDWKIENKKGSFLPAFRFIENKGDCQVEVLISKKENRPYAIVNKICNDRSKLITARMIFK